MRYERKKHYEKPRLDGGARLHLAAMLKQIFADNYKRMHAQI